MELRSIAEVSADPLIRYRELLMADGRGPATHAHALSGLRSLLGWCSDMGGLAFPLRLGCARLNVFLPETLVRSTKAKTADSGKTLSQFVADCVKSL